MTGPTFNLTTPRLTISHLNPSNPIHCSFLVSLWNTPEFISMLGGKPTSITTPSAAQALIQNRFLAEHARNGYGMYLVSLTENNTPIGTVSLMRGENSTLLAPDIGVAMLSEHMRKGKLGVKAVFGFCDAKNEASMGALRKLGMRWEGVREVKEFGGKETAVWSLGMEDVKDWGLL
ncbi:acyl-CoA N-acyltransferase [Aureobasidium sp. EXF-3400]|nr:acyl-CoA N-acyltransferase [Aureobasidium sp. EXF-12344]KAI4775801.1 acyl-CoA N-acyltransferase [Aureobasidium sp. EXF-3400]